MSKKPAAIIQEEEDSDEVIEDEEEEEFDLVAELNGMAPEARREVYGLRSITEQVRALQKAMRAERAALDAAFALKCQPLFEERRKIVTGEREATDAEIAKGTDKAESTVEEVPSDEDDTKKKPAGKKVKIAAAVPPPTAAVNGIPNFWLTAIKNHEMLESLVCPRDEEALAALTDITCEPLEGDYSKGYTLKFFFGENAFFTNKVLTKTYTYDPEDSDLFDTSKGDTINWVSPAQNVTIVIKQKKQRHKSGKGVRVVTREEKCPSFFNFFSPPDPDAEEDDDKKKGDDEDDEEEDVEGELQFDFEAGEAFKDSLIPRAVFYYTGEAIAAMASQLQMMGMDDDDEEDDDEEEEEESEEEEVRPPPRRAGGGGAGGAGAFGGSAARPAPKAGGKQPPECKQQ